MSHRNKTLASALIGTALLLTCGSVHTWAQTPPPPAALPLPSIPAAPPAAPPRQETLRFKFPAGQTLFYRLIETTEGTYKEPHSKPVPIKSHLEMSQHQTVADRRESDMAGLVDVGIDMMTITVDGKPVPPSDDSAGAQASAASLAVMAHLARLAVLPNGTLEETLVNPDVNADEALLGEDPAHMNALSGVGKLPETPVQVGDHWKSAVFLGLAGEKSSASQALTGWEMKGDASVAVIKQTLRGTFASPLPSVPAGTETPGSPAQDAAPAAGNMKTTGDIKIKGSFSGTRTVRFNVEAGCVESENSLVYMTVVLTPKEVNGFLVPPTQMWVKVQSTLTRTSAPSSAP